MKLALSAALVSVAAAALVLVTVPAAQSKPDDPEPTKSKTTTPPPTLNTCLLSRPSIDGKTCTPVFTIPPTTTKPTTTATPTTTKPTHKPSPKEASGSEHGDSGAGTLLSSCSNGRPEAKDDKMPRDFVQVRDDEIKNKEGQVQGYLQVFYSDDKNLKGVNCAQVLLKGRVEKPKHASINMKLNEEITEGGRKTYKGVWDWGKYTVLAGGVYFTNAKGRCIDLIGIVGEGKDEARLDLKKVHCGK